MHLHLRDDDMLKLVASLTSKSFAGALIMPNLFPPITTDKVTTLVLDKLYDDYNLNDGDELLITKKKKLILVQK
jgi:dihydroorotase